MGARALQVIVGVDRRLWGRSLLSLVQSWVISHKRANAPGQPALRSLRLLDIIVYIAQVDASCPP